MYYFGEVAFHWPCLGNGFGISKHLPRIPELMRPRVKFRMSSYSIPVKWETYNLAGRKLGSDGFYYEVTERPRRIGRQVRRGIEVGWRCKRIGRIIALV